MSQRCSSAAQSTLRSHGAAGTPDNEETDSAYTMERLIPLKLLLALIDAFLPGVEREVLASTDLY